MKVIEITEVTPEQRGKTKEMILVIRRLKSLLQKRSPPPRTKRYSLILRSDEQADIQTIYRAN